MRPCACLKSVLEATPRSFGCCCNCGVEIKGPLAEWCSRGDCSTQPSPPRGWGRPLLAAPLSPPATYCPLHIPARKKWLRPHLSCVYDWEALHDRERHPQESIERLSPLYSATVNCLTRLTHTHTHTSYYKLCVREGHSVTAEAVLSASLLYMVGVVWSPLIIISSLLV